MTQRVIGFVEDWIAEHVNPQAYIDERGNDPRPSALADECIADGVAAGIPRAEFEDFSPSLEERMASAINAVADAEADRRASKDR